MAEHETLSRTTGATVLTLVVVACAAGLADALRRRVRLRRRARHHAGAEQPVLAHTHTQHGAPTIPRQRATGPSAETVRLTEAERDAFAVLVRRLSEGD
ncbi:hypothetical protein AB0900_33060 [Streptomyces cellulosae]|uniref:Secreted protein n=1 Tax=Streptomyces thermocarboxydus TaxID=59299 RepID=A0ABU3JG16_9ACTN|nr:hypothetical protein [Streptomyces sp. McG7]MDT6974014.1 hypothetical protein [Streptomyces thermocarboxydus]WSB91667.1 hypothetical protein OG805_14255 [Streptomyces cellulosae]